MISYRVMLDVPRELVLFVSGLLADRRREIAVIISEDIARAHLTRGAITEAAKVAKTGVITLREIGFAMWLPKYEAIAQALRPHSRQPAVRAYLEEFAATKRQVSSQR